MKRIFKKSISVLLVVAMLLCAVPLGGLIGLDLPGIFSFEAEAATYSGTCGDNLTWTLDTSTGRLTISGTGDMTNWAYSSNVPWYSYRSYIKKVTIPDTVTSIGKYAFYFCDSLTSVTIPDSVTNIGYCAFGSCSSLANVYYTGDLAGWCGISFVDSFANPMCCADNLYIDGKILSGDVVIPEGVTRIGNYAFYGCGRLTSVTIPDSVTSIGVRAFGACHSLTCLTVNSGNTCYSNDQYGVLYNKDKTEIIQYPIGNTRTFYTIPDTVTSVGYYAFGTCDSLTSLTIPDSVTSIGDYAFYSCESLETVYYTGAPAQWNNISIGSTNSWLTSATIICECNSDRPCYTSGSCGDNLSYVLYADGELVISGTGAITSAPWYSYRSYIKTVTIGNSVTSIGSSAFYNCDSLTSITIPDSVISIGSDAFYNTAYYNNESNWENDVLCIGKHLIGAKKSISGSYAIKNDTLTIACSAFEDCYSLTSLTIPDSVASIGDDVFSGCDNLKTVYYTGDLAGWCGIIFSGEYANPMCCADNLYIDGKILSGDVVIPEGVTSVGDYAFYGCNSLTSMTIPDSVTSIGDYAFYGCDSLTDVYYTGDLAGWCGICFGKCFFANPMFIADNLYIDGNLLSGDIVIPEDVTTIGDCAFHNCDSLTNVIIPESVTTIGAWAFRDCDNLTTVTILNSATTIGEDAFYSCDSLTNVTIPDNVTTIDDWVFGWCNSLKSITIPDSVTSIGDYAFYYCESLETIYYTGTPAQWNNISIGSNNSWLTSATRIYECNSDRPFYTSGSCGTYLDYILYTDGELVISGTGAMTDWSSSSNVPWYKYRSHIKTVTINDSVISIGNYAFYDCDSLTSIIISDDITNIGSYAFHGCNSLTSITIPDGVTSIGEYAFNNCDSLETVYYTGTPEQWGKISIGSYNSSFTSTTRIYECNSDKPYSLYGSCGTNLDWILSVDGDLIISGMGEMTNWSYASSVPWSIYSSYIKTVTIPDSVTSIGDHAFDYCKSLTSVTIGNSVVSIGDSAFRYCDNLTDVYYTGDLAGWCKINFTDSYANPMWYADSLYMGGKLLSGDVVIPEGVTSIGNYAFNGYSNVTSVIIPDSVTSIGNDVFRNCDNLTSVTIGDSVTSIGDYTFYGCDSLTDVYYTGDLSEWCRINFVGFSANPLGYEVDLYIDGELLSGDIVIPEAVTSIGNWSFRYCDSITSVTIPVSVTSIGESAFLNCYSLTNVYYTGDLAGWCGISFDNSYANPMYYADNLYINGELLSGDIVIPEGVTSIGGYAFYTCDSFTSVTIPDSVMSIGDYAFYGCNSLTDVYYSGAKEKWNAISIGSGNENLTGATIRFNYVCEHSYISSITTPVSCITDGVKTFTCSKCDNSYTETIPATGHTESDAVIENIEEAKCEQIGRYDSVVYCSVCDEEISREKITVDALAHQYDEVVTAPTCTEAGYTTYTCSLCNNTYVDNEVSALGHDIVIDYAVSATCTETGLTEGQHCSRCEKMTVEQEVVPALNHKDTLFQVEAQAPTCTEIGWDAYEYCTACEYTTYAEKEALWHDIIIDKDVAPTCSETGLTEGQHCSRCDEVTIEQEEIPALGHTESDAVMENRTESKCGQAGSYDSVVYCSVCDEEISRETIFVDALSHQYNEVVTAPTCTKAGYTTYTCKLCGDTYVNNEVSALGHDIVIDKVVEATCTATGLTEGRHCSRCDDVTIEQEVVLAFNHKDTLVQVEAKAPTCTEIGWDAYEYCTACEYTTYAEKEALNHEIIIDKAVDATCTETGLTEGQHCSRCDEVTVEQETVPVKGHGYIAKYDSTKHWKECSCGSKNGEQNHSFVGGNVCSCGYKRVISSTISIKNNSVSRTINYGETLKLTAIVIDKPADAKIYWYVDGMKKGEGETFNLSFESGTKTVEVKLVDSNGNIIKNASGNEISDFEEVTVKSGFFQKLISFFKNLFGANRTVVQSIFKGVF